MKDKNLRLNIDLKGAPLNSRVGQKYPSAPGLAPAQSKAIFHVDADFGGMVKPFGVADVAMKVVDYSTGAFLGPAPKKPCSHYETRGHSSVDWCVDCGERV